MSAVELDVDEDPALALVRADLRAFAGYRSARTEATAGRVWLNANESAWANAADTRARLRRYPDAQPLALRAALAGLYGCAPEQLLVTRGSDEGIDLLVRALCRPGADAVLVTSPTFGMYAVAAALHGVRLVDVPMHEDGDRYTCDLARVATTARSESVRLVFLCSPGNPTASLIPGAEILALARRLEGRALVVVDEAYIEFAGVSSAIDALDAHPNLAVLRTLSKAHALAAARIGCVAAAPALIDVLRRCQAPYPLPAPSVVAAERALSPRALAFTAVRVATIRADRDRLQRRLAASPAVRRAFRSHANFVLARFHEPARVLATLAAAGIVVRDLRHVPGLEDALRISVGQPAQNKALLAVVDACAPGAAR